MVFVEERSGSVVTRRILVEKCLTQVPEIAGS